MGYTTDFVGEFKTNVRLDDDTFRLINGLASTRRMKRQGLDPSFGEDGEFYCGDKTDFGQKRTPDIVGYNIPPSNQPSLWLKWIVEDDRQTIVWNEEEKFYSYIEWMQYLIDKILQPKGYLVNGMVEWNGEHCGDRGRIEIKDNKITTYRLKTEWVADS